MRSQSAVLAIDPDLAKDDSGVSMMTVDGNEAAASVAHRLSEVVVIYPITPSSPMGELADEWSSKGQVNLWGQVPQIAEMQSEAGAIGAVHGALQAGSLATTFTASQGLLLMIPNMYKIAGELTPFCMHVAARTVATHALSIFGDHSDVMACRQTGFAMLCSGSVQEAHDLALIAHAATLETRVPMMHFFDGFRTSHEVAKIAQLDDDDLRDLIDDELVAAHFARALTPDAPRVRGTAQNPDTFFQAREACNPFYDACPDTVQRLMDRFAERVGRSYHLFDYVGDPEAEDVIVMMGSGAGAAEEAVERLVNEGRRVGLVKVRLYRPFAVERFLEALPVSTRRLAVLDRTKEPGSTGEPLYQDVITALVENRPGTMPRVIGGRYGLSSKEFTPAMVKAVYDHLGSDSPKRHFTVGIVDDVTHLSIPVDPDWTTEDDGVVTAVFFGLGSDGTVGANKNSIKIIGEETDFHAQGYFVYDSKKSGAMTISHLRFGPRPVRSSYLIQQAKFVACHQFNFLESLDVLGLAAPGATLLLNAPFPPDRLWGELPREVQQQVLDKGLRLYTIDGYRVARDAGMGGRVNTIMQTCFFALSGVLPRDEAIAQIKKAIQKTYGKKGEEIVQRNFAAVDAALDNLHEVQAPPDADSTRRVKPIVAEEAPDFVQKVIGVMMAGKGDLLPVSALPIDGTWPTGTTRYEKRSIAQAIPIWDSRVCIQCNKCALVCPHAAIRSKAFDEIHLDGAPDTLNSCDYKAKDLRGLKFTIQVAPEDCTGCGLCVNICPAKDKSNPRHKAIDMQSKADHLDEERINYEYFLGIPAVDRTRIGRIDAKGSQFFEPLFEYSGACAGCGETPYVKLITQLFGDRMVIANATGCSSIYGGNLPTTPYCTDRAGRGPAWANSLFEDNAEFGFGMRLSIDQRATEARNLLRELRETIDTDLADAILLADQTAEAGIIEQRQRIEALCDALAQLKGQRSDTSLRLSRMADYLVKKSVWLLGGDGWAFDIGYGGLDHVLAQNRDVNVLVLDTEVYSNTGGQASKATPLGAAAKFAATGKAVDKKDLGLMAMSYGHVYVASVAMGANDNQTIKALLEAESYPGPSLVIAYSHCIAHGYDMVNGMSQQKAAVESGVWPLYRFDPRRAEAGEAPLVIDNRKFGGSVLEYMRNETRFRMVEKQDPSRFKRMAEQAKVNAERRVAVYRHMAEMRMP